MLTPLSRPVSPDQGLNNTTHLVLQKSRVYQQNRVSIYRTWTQQLLSCLHPLLTTVVLSKHGCWVNTGPVEMRTRYISLDADSTCWSSFGDPKYFLNALVPCGHTYFWCAPVVAVLEHHGQCIIFRQVWGVYALAITRSRLG